MCDNAAATSDPVPAPRRSLRPLLQTLALDIAPPMLAYYGLRAAGTSEYVALLSATVVSGLRVVYSAIKARKLDPFALYLLLTFGLSLLVGLSTSDAKLLLAGNTLVNGIGGLIFLGSCFIGTPLTQVVADRLRNADPTEDAVPDEAEVRRRRRTQVLLSAMWGIGLLLEVAVRLVVIANLSVDAANGAASAISLSVTALLVAATIVIARRAAATSIPATP